MYSLLLSSEFTFATSKHLRRGCHAAASTLACTPTPRTFTSMKLPFMWNDNLSFWVTRGECYAIFESDLESFSIELDATLEPRCPCVQPSGYWKLACWKLRSWTECCDEKLKFSSRSDSQRDSGNSISSHGKIVWLHLNNLEATLAAAYDSGWQKINIFSFFKKFKVEAF